MPNTGHRQWTADGDGAGCDLCSTTTRQRFGQRLAPGNQRERDWPREEPRSAALLGRRCRKRPRRTTSLPDGDSVIAAETKYAQADDGVHIAYQAFGVGPYDILFVPGQISHLDLAWREPAYVRWIERLARLGRVILIDRRGVGLSDRLSPADLPPAEVLAEDLGVVLDAAGVTKPILFGFAEGGQICSLFAAMHPKRIEALITYGMWTHVRDEDRPEWARWIDWASPRWGAAEHSISDVREIFPSRAGDEAYVAFVGEMARA